MGTCKENCVYKANGEGRRVNIKTACIEVWCAKLGDWMEMNDNPCKYFKPREGVDGIQP